MSDTKYSFDVEFQEEILRFILCNDEGYEALAYVKNAYFDNLNHSVVMAAIERCHKRFSRIPSRPILREELSDMFEEREFFEALNLDDRKAIVTLITSLYSEPSKDGDIVKAKIAEFSSFVSLKDTIENHDLFDLGSYEAFASRVLRSIDIKNTDLEKDQGIFFIEGIRERQYNRSVGDFVIPTPFHQLNRLTSAGGYPPGSIIVVLDQPKKSKTTFLVNVARKYLAAKKKVLFLDLENGEHDISIRLEQSVGRVDKKGIIKNIEDKAIQKILRRYKRLGGEIYIKRLPALSTTRDFQVLIDRVYRTRGIKFDIVIVDYIGLMGTLSGKTDDFGRISDAYIDMANFLFKNGFEHCYTAHHVQRQAAKRKSLRYYQDDIAKCIDIVRHAQVIVGLNRTEMEEANGVMRLEIVEQREGVPEGRAFFRIDPVTQRIDELTKKEIEEAEAMGILYSPEQLKEESQEPKRGDI
jgi:KaiC/GvpD/RAD55 family RecA-like ATPase